MTTPTPASLVAPPQGLTPNEVKMTFADLINAAKQCRAVADSLEKQAGVVATANVAAAAANPATALAAAATQTCGADLPNSLGNVVFELRGHADALDKAVAEHVENERTTALVFGKTHSTGVPAA